MRIGVSFIATFWTVDPDSLIKKYINKIITTVSLPNLKIFQRMIPEILVIGTRYYSLSWAIYFNSVEQFRSYRGSGIYPIWHAEKISDKMRQFEILCQ